MAGPADFLAGAVMIYVLLPVAAVIALFMIANAQYRIAAALRGVSMQGAGYAPPADSPAFTHAADAPDDDVYQPVQVRHSNRPPGVAMAFTVGLILLVVSAMVLAVIILANLFGLWR